ncbi:efflux RND transporter periplasmic adaptor subunit [Cellulophaga baltica]|uniref:efflux RND transporter periplasmic adaptor subunit n=1 Tax=Cellulophaga sp. 1_MG-2023 TaxID=3062632 RepID=UPI001C069253|nr:efflux RND transporter periplasmic adaptor subunit [Cellulophaga sp. 1_MG-2023]MBU2996763.1 efflux RND transporter periplasmic adaptor subunit [Cellulophaga baltica]MDO6768159.1 efflux RND transporter periplasmic adaptor subunit [Cellulophaga sp. 1_MG-2023]
MKKFFILMTFCALIVQTSCGEKKEKKEEEAEFLVSSPIKMDTSITEDYVSQIKSIRHIEIRAQERGYLKKIYVDEGEHVKQGQLLFQIMPNLYEAEMKKAKAEADYAQIEYENTKKLADSNVVAPNELAMAKAQLEKANAELALANVHLDFTQIRAPFDGIIDRFLVRPGSLVDEGELLTNLADNSKMWVYFNVPEAEYLDFKIHMDSEDDRKVNLLMANNQLFSHEGKIETIEADFNNETGNIPFRATFPNPEGLLRHGETGSILMKMPFNKALLIPQKATFEVLDKKYVYVVNNENIIQSREVVIGSELPHLYAITSGLSEDDKILIEGLGLVRENEEIHSEFVKPEEVLAHLELTAE